MQKTDYNEISEILENRLYLTNYGAVILDSDKVVNLKIDIIVSILDTKPFSEELPLGYENIELVHYDADDQEDVDLTNFFFNFCNLMENNPGKKVLVHCFQGVSRSSSLIIAYLIMLKENLELYPLEYFISLVKIKRNFIKPNKSFLKQLENFRLYLISNK